MLELLFKLLGFIFILALLFYGLTLVGPQITQITTVTLPSIDANSINILRNLTGK
jgi:hypothetical protein